MDLAITFRIDPFPSNDEMNALWEWAWDDFVWKDFSVILARSLAHVGAYDGQRLIGFVNVAWDGGLHAFLLDTCVHPKFRRQGMATQLVKEAENLARDRGAFWLHVDFEARLTGFYRGCGFRMTGAGLIKLQP
ncbi:GNAT family N-acetyltransferase [uncultured Phyllobacterium sp.]|uniref:GNAT family N-acetyltransferase n=1 Tax=uncultured Phyllobacterium sp. TaxID=253813 RepID=UPI0025832F98|nr:GNAT family N-acetyltransferase [uncultured Phyllobacterium sp.]